MEGIFFSGLLVGLGLVCFFFWLVRLIVSLRSYSIVPYVYTRPGLSRSSQEVISFFDFD